MSKPLGRWAKYVAWSVAIMVMFGGISTPTNACTSVIVGKEVSVDGSIIISRNEDMSGAWTKKFIVVPRTEYKEGEMFVAYNGLKIAQPKVGYKYTALPDWDPSEGQFEAAGINEYQVAVSATNSAQANEKAIAADPFIEAGVGEPILPTLLLPRITTAEEGVTLFGNLIEQYGANEAYGFFIADPKSAWYVETGSGHRWAAVKVPADHYLTLANVLVIGDVKLDDPENYRGAKDVVEFAKANQLYDPATEAFDFAKAYGAKIEDPYSTRRIWWAQHLLTPSVQQDPEAKRFPLFMKPDKKIGLKDVMNVLRSRYEGTQYCPDVETGKTERTIAVERTMESHIIQLRDWLPNDLGGVLWLDMANPVYSVYLPFYSGITDTPAPYKSGTDRYDDSSAYWVFRAVGLLAATNPEQIGKGIIEFWGAYQDRLIAEQATIDQAAKQLYADKKEAAGREFLMSYSHGTAFRALAVAAQMKQDILSWMASSKTDKAPFQPGF